MQPPQAPQQIIDQAQRQAQQSGQEELPRLGGDRQLHQPKSRAKKPPASRAASS